MSDQTKVKGQEVIEAAVNWVTIKQLSTCTCSGFVLQYECTCQCGAGKLATAAKQRLERAVVNLIEAQQEKSDESQA